MRPRPETALRNGLPRAGGELAVKVKIVQRQKTITQNLAGKKKVPQIRA